MRSKSILVVVVVMSLSLCVVPTFAKDYDDGLTHNINRRLYEGIDVSNGPEGNATTVNVLSGGRLTGSLWAYEDSKVNIYGGIIDSDLRSFDKSQINISGGSVGSFSAYDESKVYISGGTILGGVYAGGEASPDMGTEICDVYISGGVISGSITAGSIDEDSSRITIYGRNFAVDGTQVAYGECLYSSGHLTGRLPSGEMLNNDFSIRSNSSLTFVPGPDELLLLSPNGSEQIPGGSIHSIEWATYGSIDTILLEYSADNGSTWIDIDTVSGTNSYQWTVPEINSEDCLMRISNADDSNVNDTSDGLFSVYSNHLTLNIPNGGEALIAGLSCNITWLAKGTAENVRIEYSRNAGDTWTGIATTANTGSYLWELNGPESHEYLIRISDTDFPNINDTSDSTFTVSTCQDDIVGDINGDCIVNLLDLAMIAQNWLTDGYVRIFLYDLEQSPSWTIEGQWEYGQPLGLGGSAAGHSDPDSGSSGSNVYGVNLSGDYTVAIDGPYSLIAGPYDCRSFHDLRLRFARWLNTDGPDYVFCTFDVSNNGSDWQTVWQNDSTVTDSTWQGIEYDVSMTADNQQAVYFRWTYEILHDRAYPHSGWNIDDIELLGKR